MAVLTDLQIANLSPDEVIAALTPAQKVALTLWGEARGAKLDFDHDGIADLVEAIGSVVVNRTRQHRGGRTADAVCLAHGQFSCWSPIDGPENYGAVLSAARHLIAARPCGPVMRACLGLADAILAATHPDRVQGATHYFSPAAMVPRDAVPDWAQGRVPAAVIEGTQFFAGIP